MNEIKKPSTNLVNRACRNCGNGFVTQARYVSRGAAKYCSRGCSRAGTRTQVEKLCPQCGKNFFAFYYLRNLQTYCSAKCARERPRPAIHVERECLSCGKQFLKLKSQFRHFKGAGKYCSRACSYKGTVTANAKKPIKDRWGRTKLKADTAWRDAVRLKDKSTCQRCGKVDPYIHTHHVAPRSRRPDLKHEVANGKCLCASCHQWVHWNPIEATKLGLLSDATYERARKAVCKICGLPNQAFGLCAKHYDRWRKHGDPNLAHKPGRRASGAEPAPMREAVLARLGERSFADLTELANNHKMKLGRNELEILLSELIEKVEDQTGIKLRGRGKR